MKRKPPAPATSATPAASAPRRPDTAIAEAVAARAEDLKKLALEVHAHPETGFNERLACRLQVELLRRWGFRVRSPYAGMATAFRAEIGRGRPTVALLSEYDALEQLGHGCGHNLICAASLGAAAGLAAALRQRRLAGRVVLLGTPAEETVGGKVPMVEQGVFKDVDMAIMAHPAIRTQPWAGSTAVSSFQVRFAGHSAHAAANPSGGRNALDAVRLLFAGVDAWRQQLTEDARIHGIITAGGAAPNIIPDDAACFFFLRSERDDILDGMIRRFEDIARGAALMTDTTASVEAVGMRYRGSKINAPLNDAYVHYAAALGMKPVRPRRPGRGSTDFSDVSQAVPGTHVYFGITSRKIAIHSPEFRQAAATPQALGRMLRAAEALANVGLDFLADEGFRRRVREDFHYDYGHGNNRGGDGPNGPRQEMML